MPSVKNIFSDSLDGLGNPFADRSQENLEQMINRSVAARAYAAGKLNIVARPIMHARDAMWVTCSSWMHEGRGINLFVNPSQMQWSLPRRGTVVKTAAGAVRNVWRNRYKGTYYDEGTIAITFQAGNIMPSNAYDNSELRVTEDAQRALATPRPPWGLVDFYEFLELLDVPMLMGVGENYHILSHRSQVFPRMMLYGYFTEDSMNFSEVATDGNRLEWQATFQIYQTIPRFQQSSDLISSYNGMVIPDEQIGPDIIKRIEAHKAQLQAAKDAAAIAKTFGGFSLTPNKPKTVATSTDTKKIIATAGQAVSGVQVGQLF